MVSDQFLKTYVVSARIFFKTIMCTNIIKYKMVHHILFFKLCELVYTVSPKFKDDRTSSIEDPNKDTRFCRASEPWKIHVYLCFHLEEIQPSFGHLEKLAFVEIDHIRNYTMPPDISLLKELETLALSRFSSGCLRKLDLS